MIRFLTPMRGAVPEDLVARTALLQQAPEQLRTGFELILLEDDYKALDQIVRNLQYSLYKVFSVHVPFPQVGGIYADYDVLTPLGQEKIRAAADIAQQIGAGVVVIHSQLAFSHEDWKIEYDTFEWRNQLFNKIFSVITSIQAEYPTVRLCLENMPLPLFADSDITPDQIRFNPCLITFEDMEQAVQAGVSITWDICHYDMMRRVWHSWLDRYTDIDQNLIREQEGVVGIYPAGRQPEYLELAQKLESGLGHLHLADSSGLWQNTVSMPTGGLALGTGEQDRAELGSLLQFLEANSREYTINLEVKDKDMQKLQETAQSLRYLAQLLYVK